MHNTGFLLITLLAVTGVGLTESDDELFTMEHYEALALDMTYDEVVEIMGAEGTKEEPDSEDHPNLIYYTWTNPNDSYISVEFEEGLLITKLWCGLAVEPD